jgi:uncharacterized surface protein with fasciclin (FAS1) repeats
MKHSFLIYLHFFCALLFLSACNDYYDDHYPEAGSSEQDKLPSLLELIKENNDLSIFAEMLQITGYDRYLASEQTYTVFASLNSALSTVDLKDTLAVANIVKTQIARFSYPAVAPLEAGRYGRVTMVNGKIIPLTSTAHAVTIGNSELILKNRQAKNGILHTVNGIVPFQPNIWETLLSNDMDSIRNFLYSFNVKQFSRFNSTIIDYQNGLAVYDSVFFESNSMFYNLGYLNDEDSLYTMILPTNKAWKEAYEQRKDYFVTEDDTLQHFNTQVAIIKDLVFRGALSPDNFIPGDTLFSTQETPFTEPKSLFEGATQQPASNGLVYRTDQLRYNHWESWQPEILIEAEYMWIDPRNAIGPFRRFSNDTLISNGQYLAVSPQTTSQAPVVHFYIPGTRSAHYNIYAVFVPERYDFPADSLGKARIQYQVQQLDLSTAGRPVEEQKWNHIASGGASGGGYKMPDDPDPITSTKEVRKILLAENFKFPRANINELYTTIRIAITNVRGRNDSQKEFRYRMFIDCLILEPVKN